MNPRLMVLAVPVAVAVVAVTFMIEPASSQLTFRARDPGVRGGLPGAGGPLAGLTDREVQFFEHGRDDFNEAEEVDEGLGPRMNLDGCGGCHSQPAIGGSSPAVNPQ